MQDVDEHGCAVVCKALAGNGMLGQGLGETLGGLAKSFFILQRLVFTALGIDDDGLEAL